MDNAGMTYELTLDPFILRGVVGDDAQLLMRPGYTFECVPVGTTVLGRRSFEELIDKLYTLQNVAAGINGNKGAWAYSFTQTVQAKEEGGDGVPVQDLA